MGKTVPLFRIALAMEKKQEGKPFPYALDKSDGKKIDVPLPTIILMSPASSEVYRATDWPLSNNRLCNTIDRRVEQYHHLE